MPNLPVSLSSPIGLSEPAALGLLALAALVLLIWRTSLRGLSKERHLFLLALRLVILLLLVVALAGPTARQAAKDVAVAFLVDRSDSISIEGQAGQESWIRQAVAAKGQHDQFETIVFAKEALMDGPLSSTREAHNVGSKPASDQTNIAAAIRLAMSTLPSNAARKIVLLSDGAENSGNALAEARIAASAGIPISYWTLPPPELPEVFVRQVDLPSTLREQDTFNIGVTIDASLPTIGTVRILVDGRLDTSADVQFAEGSNVLSFPHGELVKGFHRIAVTIETAQDTIFENNQGTGHTSVIGKAKVLIVESIENAGRFLAQALLAGGIDVQVRAPASVPSDLRDYDSVVLVNVRADQLSPSQHQNIKTYVQSFGGGLVVVGGDQSYGVGGYARTPLEDVLPVSMDLRARKLQSSVALVLVIDTSGSMAEGPTGATKMDMAKLAAMQAIDLLGDQDQVGVLAFEDTFRWIVMPREVADRSEVKRLISTLNPGGGTEIFPALRETLRATAQIDAKVRHVILMSDGIAPSGDYDTLMAQLRAEGITLSSIAVGTDADFGLLQRLADQGAGRYYEGIDPYDVPRLTVKETLEIARAAIVEEPVQVGAPGASPILQGLELATMPKLNGYVATTAKPSSTTVLASHNEDPLLVEWQYGLGEVVAWTSDVENRWAADLLLWPQFSQFWTQLVKRTIPAQLERNIHLSVVVKDDQAHVVVDSRNDAGSYLNMLSSEILVSAPGGQQMAVPLRQTAPGRYEGFFPAGEQGAYAVHLVQRSASDNAVIGQQSGGLVIPYSPEYQDLAGNERLLAALAVASGGEALHSPAQAFAPGRLAAQVAGRELWPYLTAAALLLFLLDVALRRLRIGTEDIRRLAAYALEGGRKGTKPLTNPTAGRLLEAKRRLVSRTSRVAPAPDRRATPRQRAESGLPSSPQPRQELASAASRLLEAKRRAGRDDGH